MIFSFKPLFFPAEDVTLLVYQKHLDFNRQHKVEGQQDELNERDLGDLLIDDDCKQEQQKRGNDFPQGWIIDLNLIAFFAFIEVHHANNTVVKEEQERVNIVIIDQDSEEEVSHIDLDED